MTIESQIQAGLMSEARVLDTIAEHGSLTISALAKLHGITPRGARMVCMRLVDKEQLYIVPMTSPREFSLDAAYADKVKPEPREEDDGQPLRITRPAGTWERKHAYLMARPTWFEGVAP